jgi:23S rRNA (adenine2030-N6)-methyltransferase
MLSYRHAFHAGNHADILKHFVLHQLLQYLNQKDKPYWIIDTHAGAGVYALDQGYAAKNAEYESGIARLWSSDDLPPPLADYLALVRELNADGGMKLYPGSPWIADQALRANDKLRLFELHPTDFKLLQENFQNAGRRVKIEQADGFAGLKALLPPPPRRALVLIDPPYEEKQDYQRVPNALEDALKRFETGTYTVWYPILQRPELRTFIDKLKRLPAKSWLHVSLTVNTPSPDGFGMTGSGMFVLNPPWTLHSTLQSVMPWLTKTLAQDSGAGYVLEQSAN